MLEEITKNLAHFLTQIINDYGLIPVFVFMTAESALIPIPSEITMAFAGFMAARGAFNIWLAIFIGALGNLIGSLLAYWLGYVKGEDWVRYAIRKWGKWLLLKEEEFDKSKVWFSKYGQGVAFVSRLLPIVRTFISLPAGIAKMNIPLFSLLTFVGSFIWSTLLTFMGFKLGENWTMIEPYFKKFQFVIVGLGVATVTWYLWSHLKNHKTENKGV